MKKKYSTLLNFALAACVATTLVACSGDDGDKTTTGPTIKNGAPRVSIGGTVLDTNGNPLQGVWVTCQNSRVQTNQSGVYYHEKMQVMNVAGSREGTSNSYDEFDQPVQCVVEAPAGYLGAHVWVYPEAQVVNTLYDNTSEDNSQVNQPLIWFDNMFAQAATAWLPSLDSEVCGVLRFCETGEPVIDAQLRLDMWAVDNNSVNEQADSYGYTDEVTYSTPMYSTTTDHFLGQEGTFCIANVPDDSILRLYAPQYKELMVEGNGYADVSGSCSGGDKPCNNEGAYITTTNEGTVNLGNVCVNTIPASDDIQPCVADIEGWINRDGWSKCLNDQWGCDELRFARLNDDIDGTDGIDIIFNEALRASAVDENSVVIFDETAGDYIADFTAELTSANTLTVTTADPIPDGHKILVYMLRSDFRDLAGNFLTHRDLPSDDACGKVFFTEDFVSLNGTPYVVAGFVMAAEDSTDAEAVTALQQECTDYSKTVSGQTDLQDEYPTVFRSEKSSSNTFYNMNADADYEYRLEALADVLECPNDVTSQADIVQGYATVSFMPNTVGSWQWGDSSDGYCDDNCWGGGETTTQYMVVYNVDPGDTIYVESIDDFDNISAVESVVLGDCVAPTTVLNYAYNTCGHLGQDYNGSWEVNDHPPSSSPQDGSGPGFDTDNAAHLCVDFEAATLFEYGDGGENTGEGTPGVCGIPTLNITCRLLKDPADASEGAVVEPITFFGLYDGTNTPAPQPGYGPYEDFSLYDSTEFAAWVPFADTIGVAFSENIAMTDGGDIDWNGVTDITSWTIGNNIGITDDGDTPDGGPDADDSSATSSTVDLVQITVSDVLSLANDDHLQIMDFSAAVEDLAGNAADNAMVVINDLMPPFVEYAYWDGGMTIKFNETVAPDIDSTDGTPADSIVLWDTTGSHDVISLDGATLSGVDGGTDNLLEIPAANLLGVTGSENFPSTSDTTYALVYDEDIYDDLGFTGPYQHGAMTWGSIPDARGNRWADYDSVAHGTVLYMDTDGTELCNMPAFAVADVLGPFTVTGINVSNFQNDAPATCSGAPGASGSMPANVNHVMTYSFSHPVNLERQYWEDADATGSIDCAAATATDLCTLAEVNNGLTNGAWVDAYVLANGGSIGGPTSIGNITELTGVSAALSADRMSMNITIRNNSTACYTWATDDYLNPEWIVWSAFNVGTGKDLNLQVAP